MDSQTPWQSKYGSHYDLDNNISGFTPLTSEFPSLMPVSGSPEDVEITRRKDIENFQRRALFGYTTRELESLDCLATREIRPSTLYNQIIPLFEQSNWEITPAQPEFTRTEMYRIAGRHDDQIWSAHNDTVWQILQPCLKLASRMLLSANLLPWFDTLVNSPRVPIPPSRLTADDKDHPDLFSIHPSQEFHPVSEAVRDRIFFDLVNKYDIQFAFCHPDEDPRGPDAQDDTPSRNYAFTTTNDVQMTYQRIPGDTWRIFVFINIQSVEALLQNDCNTPERMSIELQLATICAHEVIHAIEMMNILDARRYDQLASEPYVGNEPVMELGSSYENAVHGGRTDPMIDVEHPLPLGFWHSTRYPTIVDVAFRLNETPVLMDPELPSYQDRHPVPITVYEDAQSEGFWDVAVRKYGYKTLWQRALKSGARTNYAFDAKDKHKAELLQDGDPIRINEEGYSAAKDDLARKSILLASMASLNHEGLQLLQFARALQAASTACESFWDESELQNAQVAKITLATAALTNNVFPEHIFNQVKDSIVTHSNQIRYMIEWESSNPGVIHTDKRQDLFTWNKGTRNFIRKFPTSLNLEGALLDLEKCRLNLWHPSDSNPTADEDRLEYSRSVAARTNFENGNHALATAMATLAKRSPNRSYLGEMCAELILDIAKRAEWEGWGRRSGRIVRHKKNLNDMARMVWSRGWDEELASWVRFTSELNQM